METLVLQPELLLFINHLHLFLSCVAWFAASLFSPILARSSLMFCCQVNFRAPRGILIGLSYSVKAVRMGVSSGSLITCPNIRNLLVLMVSLHGFSLVFSYSSSELIFCGHLMFMAFLIIRRWLLSIAMVDQKGHLKKD